jgi:hypothetical protein
MNSEPSLEDAALMAGPVRHAMPNISPGASLENFLRIDRYALWLWRWAQARRLLAGHGDQYQRWVDGLGKAKGPALVVGSAPNPTLPKGVDETWLRVSVNASQAVLAHFGLPDPHLTVFQPKIKFADAGRDAYWRVLSGLGTEHLVFIVNGKNDGEIAPFLREKRYRTDKITACCESMKAAITADVTGRFLLSPFVGQRSISNGVFAALLALKMGARPVVMSGFSLRDGYFHSGSQQAKRNHVYPDFHACREAALRGHPLFAADAEFAAATGLPLWRGGLFHSAA